MFTDDHYIVREDDGVLTACIVRDREIASSFNVAVIADESNPVDAESERVGFKQ